MSHYHDHNSVTLDLHRQGRFAHLEPRVRLSRGEMRCHNTRCGLLGMTILLSISAFIMSGLVFIKLNFSPPENDDGKICFTTTDLKLSPFRDKGSDIEKLSKEVNDNQFVYCASTPEQMQIILNWVIDNKTKAYVDKYYDNVTNNLLEGNAVSAHVLIDSREVSEVNKNTAVKLFERRSLSHYDGINVGPHKLVIKTKGTYFLYSQIHFKLISGVNYHQPLNISFKLSHQVVRFRQRSSKLNGQVALLQNEQQTRVKHGEADHRSSFVSGTFEMIAGDEIGVMVTNLSYISRQPETNFIGLFLLGNIA